MHGSHLQHSHSFSQVHGVHLQHLHGAAVDFFASLTAAHPALLPAGQTQDDPATPEPANRSTAIPHMNINVDILVIILSSSFGKLIIQTSPAVAGYTISINIPWCGEEDGLNPRLRPDEEIL